jgi:hypothetical protein
LGAVGLNWQFSGIGDFSGAGESDMLLRSSNTGGLEAYDINNSQITNAASPFQSLNSDSTWQSLRCRF